MPSNESSPRGRIITFYSYKGGTGRSMALANIAWILASAGKRILVIDWDLEAPGVYRYFRPFLRDPDLMRSPGLIDFAIDFATEALTEGDPADGDDWFRSHANILRYAQALQWADFRPPGSIDFVPAGRQDAGYSTAVNTFDWKHFFRELGGGDLFDEVRKRLQIYDYVLIDSRTGVSDTSGICTIHMPDTVVLCFTFNVQSIEGAAGVARSIDQYPLGGGRQRIRIFPVPTRVDYGEIDRLEVARNISREMFNPLLWHIPEERRVDYWGDVEVPYRSSYAFEETLATFADRPRVQNSVLRSLERLSSYISDGDVEEMSHLPEEKRIEWYQKFLRTPNTTQSASELVMERAERAYGRFTAEMQQNVLRILTRLVRVTPPDERSPDTRRKASVQELPSSSGAILADLLTARVISPVRSDSDTWYELADDALIDWAPLRHEVERDRQFLLWRQQFSVLVETWLQAGRDSSALMGSTPLVIALRQYHLRAADLNEMETAFIRASLRRRQVTRYGRVAGVTLPIVTALVLYQFGRLSVAQAERVLADAPAVTALAPRSEEALEWVDALNSARFTVRAGEDAQRIVDSTNRAIALAKTYVAAKQRAESRRASGLWKYTRFITSNYQDADQWVNAWLEKSKSTAIGIGDEERRIEALRRVAETIYEVNPSESRNLISAAVEAASKEDLSSPLLADVAASAAIMNREEGLQILKRAVAGSSTGPAWEQVRTLGRIARALEGTPLASEAERIYSDALSIAFNSAGAYSFLGDVTVSQALNDIMTAELGPERSIDIIIVTSAREKNHTDDARLTILSTINFLGDEVDQLPEGVTAAAKALSGGIKGGNDRCIGKLHTAIIAGRSGDPDAAKLVVDAEKCEWLESQVPEDQWSSSDDPVIRLGLLAVAKAGIDDPRGLEALQEGFQAAAKIRSDDRKTFGYAMLAAFSARAKLPEFARVAMDRVPQNDQVAWLFVIRTLARVGSTNEATALIKSLSGENAADVTEEVSRRLLEDGKVDEAILIANASRITAADVWVPILRKLKDMPRPDGPEDVSAQLFPEAWHAAMYAEYGKLVAQDRQYERAAAFAEAARKSLSKSKWQKNAKSSDRDEGEDTESVQVEDSESYGRRLTADLYARLGEVKEAREIGGLCRMPNDKLSAYSSVIREAPRSVTESLAAVFKGKRQ